jgi:hypothetical protein
LATHTIDVADLTNAAIRVVRSNEWDLMQEKHGVRVWKAKSNSLSSKGTLAGKYPCVKAEALINVSPEELVRLMTDSSRVHEYNKYSAGRTDVEMYGPGTKIVWNRTRPAMTLKGHDFCTLMHCFRLEDGSYVMVTKGVEHPLVPKRDDFTRSEILLGVNVMRRASKPQQTEFISISHVRYSGVPSILANKVCVQAAHDFVRQLQLASSSSSTTQSY